MNILNRRRFTQSLAGLGAASLAGLTSSAYADTTILNVSFDPTRELYKAINDAFVPYWKAKTGETITVQASHGGSGAQARSVIEGLPADVVTLALSADIDAIAKAGKLKTDWPSHFPNNSTPYTSTIVLLVRKGNPKGIKDWGDLAKPGVGVITPDPKTSGGARWNYLAAWAFGQKTLNNDAGKIRSFIAAVYKNVLVLDTGARAATLTFAQRGLGDVLIAWENDALLATKEFASDGFEVVVPSLSILAETPVAIVDSVVDAKGTRKQAEGYLTYLYTPDAQKIVAANYFRPTDPKSAAPEDLARFKQIPLVTIADFGGWTKVQQEHFADGGIYDQLQNGNH